MSQLVKTLIIFPAGLFVGFSLGLFLAAYSAKKMGDPPSRIWKLRLWGILLFIIGLGGYVATILG